MSNLKTYVAELRIFQKYPILEVIEYDQNRRIYKKTCLLMAFARISLFSSVICWFKSYTYTMPDTWYTLNKY